MVKVSIIVPVYNMEKYLEKCLESLVHQTLDDIEIIVVNDGSKDNSQDIINRYVELYPLKIKSYIKENGGLSDARNYGIARSNGDYVGFVDSDDYVENDMFELLYNEAISENCDMVDSSYYTEEENDYKIIGDLPKEISKEEYIKNFTVCFCTKIVHRKLLDKVGLIPKIWHEDVAYMPVVASYANKIGFVHKPLYHYYTREGSISNNFFNIKVLDLVKAIDYAVLYSNEDYKSEIVFSMLNLLNRNVSYRWVYSDAFINKIQELEKYVDALNMREKYPELVNKCQKYWDLSKDNIPRIVYVNGFGQNLTSKDTCNLQNHIFYDNEKIVVLDEQSCDITEPMISKCYQEQKYSFLGAYFAFKRIVSEGGVYINRNLVVDVPLNALLPYDVFCAYSGFGIFSSDIFGAKKEQKLFVKVIEIIEEELKEGGYPEIELIFAKCMVELYGFDLDGQTKLFENNFAVLSLETMYCFSERLKKENIMHFCHYNFEYTENNMVSIPVKLFEYYKEKTIENIINQKRCKQLWGSMSYYRGRVSQYEKSTIWKMTSPLRTFLDNLKNIKKNIVGELQVDYIKLILERRKIERQYRIPKQLLQKYSQQDCIKNYKTVIEFCEELKKEGYETNCPIFTLDPGAYYGIQSDMLQYAGIRVKNGQIKDYALIEHGAHFQDIAPFGGEGKRRYTGYITLGDFRKNYVLKKYGLPVYMVGPYIAYADQYYSEQKLIELKRKWGRVLLIFYAHNHEWLHKEYENNEFIEFVKRQKRDFDTIILSCYWADLTNKYVKKFEEIGVKIVSFGFRSDDNFMKRQKSLLTLADSVLTNDIGSHVGYAVYMDKPVTFFSTKVTEAQSKERLTDQAAQLIEINKNKIAKYFTRLDGKLNTVISEEQKEVCNPIFGFAYVKNKEEMKAIFLLAEEIYKKSKKKVGSYSEAIKLIISELEASSEEFDQIKLRILKEALK